MIKLSQIIILNVPKREREGKYLKKLIETSTKPYGIPVSISMDRGKGLWDNYSQALTQEVAEGTHRMIIHDDITFDRNILAKILHILSFAPENNVISFYNPTNGDYTDCYAKGKHVISTKTNFWLQASVYPNDLANDFVETSNKMTDDQTRYDDSRLKAYLQAKGIDLYAIVPGLVQHFGAYRSTFNNPGAVGGIPRNSKTYDNQFDVESVDWESEFKNPYLAKSSKDWVKEIVNKEFLDEYKNSKENLALKLAKDNIEVEQVKPLHIEYVKVDDIYPNDYNPNTHDADSFDLLIKSLLYFGFTQPIVVNRSTMQIVDGENRYRAACVIGYEMVPVCFVDFDEEKLRYATIMHNAARGHNNKEMMGRLKNYLDTHFSNSSDKVLLNNRKK